MTSTIVRISFPGTRVSYESRTWSLSRDVPNLDIYLLFISIFGDGGGLHISDVDSSVDIYRPLDGMDIAIENVRSKSTI
jgi:hypothetical protein